MSMMWLVESEMQNPKRQLHNAQSAVKKENVLKRPRAGLEKCCFTDEILWCPHGFVG
jgi:hypothetical protein